MRQKWHLALGLAVLAALLPAAGDEAAGQAGDVDGNGTDDLIWNGLADGDEDYIDDALEDELAQKFAPVVYLHSTDGDRPWNVEDYLHAVELRFDDPGSSETDPVIAERGSLTVTSLINIKSLNPPGGECEFDKDPVEIYPQYSGFKNGQRPSCFYLRHPDNEVRHGSVDPNDWVAYVHVRMADARSKHLGMIDVQYWFFYAFNANVVGSRWEHQGDWEHVTVRVEPDRQGWKIHDVYYARHTYFEGAWAYPKDSGKTPYFEVENGHPVVYSAWHSHGNYAHAGEYDRWCEIILCPDKTDKGPRWDTSDNLQNIGEWAHPRPGREWIQYTGRWGVPDHVTAIEGGVHADGPRGPAIGLNEDGSPVGNLKSWNGDEPPDHSDNLPSLQGDADCKGTVDSVDALKLLRHVAALSVSQQPGCTPIGTGDPLQGDVDCNGAVNSVDALKVLRYVAGLSVAQEPGCPAVGTPGGGGWRY